MAAGFVLPYKVIQIQNMMITPKLVCQKHLDNRQSKATSSTDTAPFQEMVHNNQGQWEYLRIR